MKIVKNVLFGNIVALAILQVATYLAPLLIIPYLTRVLGPSGYGEITIIISVIQISLIITDFGFNLSSTEYIAKNKGNVVSINRHIGAVFQAKILLLAICFAIIYIYVMHSGYINYELLIYIYMAIMGQTFQSLWFFQGVEKMKRITVFLTLSKFIYVIGTFLLVKNEATSKYAILAFAVSQIFGALLSQYYMKREGYNYVVVPFSNVLDVLKNSMPFFWSRLAVSTYTTASTLVVGTAGHAQAGYYSASEQLYKAGQNIMTPVSQALYPYMVRSKNWSLFFKMIMLLGAGLLVLSIIAISLSHWLIQIIFGADYLVSQNIFIIFMLALVVTFVSTNFGYPVFSALGHVKYANYTVMIGAALHVIILGTMFLLREVSAGHVVIAVLFTESFILVFRLFLFYRLYRRVI